MMAAPYGVESRELYERTGGNPFFVVEALAARTQKIPATVREAVLARARPLSPGAKELLDAVAVVPQRAELWLVEALAGEAIQALDECVSAGMLEADPAGVAFRHELARLSIEESVGPGRKTALHRKVLAALADRPGGVLTFLAWRITPKQPATPRPSSGSPLPPPNERPRWVLIARRRPSTHGCSGSVTG